MFSCERNIWDLQRAADDLAIIDILEMELGKEEDGY